VWQYLKPNGRIVATANNLETLYQFSEGFSNLQARNIEIVQAAVNRLETRGIHEFLPPLIPCSS
jgi:cobalt-precorrin-6B (C15)-methyltransferase